MTYKKLAIVFVFCVLMLESKIAYAHGDMVIAGLGAMSAVLQLIAIVWALLSQTVRPIRFPSVLILIVVFLPIWVALDIAPSKEENTILLLWLVNIIPIIMMIGIKVISKKVGK